MRVALAFALAAITACVACGSRPAPAPVVLQGTLDAKVPIGPAPAFEWKDGAFAFARLPAVSFDGRTVVVPIVDRDSERGNANLRFVLRDRHDRDKAEHVVLAVQDGDAMFDANGPTLDFQQRIGAGNAWLRDQNEKLGLVPLTVLTSRLRHRDESQLASEGDLEMTWTETGRLAIRQRGRVLVDRVLPKWIDTSKRPCLYCTTGRCSHPAYLHAAAVDAARTIAVITILYGGESMCPAPPDRTHVVSW